MKEICYSKEMLLAMEIVAGVVGGGGREEMKESVVLVIVFVFVFGFVFASSPLDVWSGRYK